MRRASREPIRPPAHGTANARPNCHGLNPVADAGQFSEAAADLSVTQQAVSDFPGK